MFQIYERNGDQVIISEKECSTFFEHRKTWCAVKDDYLPAVLFAEWKRIILPVKIFRIRYG